MQNIYEFEAVDIHGQKQSMSQFQNKVLLFVNTASRCGFTSQYEDLEKLYQSFSKRGFVVLAFPCNQFGQQEPGTSQEIQEFCQSRYSVSFPIFEKIEVNGPSAHPLFSFLKEKQPSAEEPSDIKWNFEKFLVSPKGEVVARMASSVTGNELSQAVEKLLD